MRILIVEDERPMAAVLANGLREENHNVVVAHDGREALGLAASHDFDVMILDAMLPGVHGFDVARQLRQARNSIPIVMLTARDSVRDVVAGLDCGADDYLTKPFAFDELLARLRAAVRHRHAAADTRLEVGDLVLDPARRKVTRGSVPIALSATEYRLLEFMMRRAGRVVARADLIEGVWGFEEIEDNTLDAFMRLLRNKIDRPFERQLLRTVRGLGYTLGADGS